MVIAADWGVAEQVYYNQDMKTIAQNLGYDNEQVARNKKYLCLKKLKAFIKENPNILKYFNLK